MLAPVPADLGVLGMQPPRADGRLAFPVGHGDAESPGFARGLHAEEAGLDGGQRHHPLRRGGVAGRVFAVAQGTEDDRVVRRLGQARETGVAHGTVACAARVRVVST